MYFDNDLAIQIYNLNTPNTSVKYSCSIVVQHYNGENNQQISIDIQKVVNNFWFSIASKKHQFLKCNLLIENNLSRTGQQLSEVSVSLSISGKCPVFSDANVLLLKAQNDINQQLNTGTQQTQQQCYNNLYVF